jgi:hypothetical protein
MAIVHRAELTPGKLDLIAAWLPGQDWFTDAGPIERVATFRLDDPDGRVGIETFIVSSGDAVFHVPLTYRDAPLQEGSPVGEMEHSVLGHRWVYDGPSDPVYVAVTAEAIVTGGHEVGMFFEDGTELPRPDWIASVTGTGTPAKEDATLQVVRRLPGDVPASAPRLDATWAGLSAPVTVAWLG